MLQNKRNFLNTLGALNTLIQWACTTWAIIIEVWLELCDLNSVLKSLSLPPVHLEWQILDEAKETNWKSTKLAIYDDLARTPTGERTTKTNFNAFSTSNYFSLLLSSVARRNSVRSSNDKRMICNFLHNLTATNCRQFFAPSILSKTRSAGMQFHSE